MAIIELHRGGRDPIELARLEEEAASAMAALNEALDEWDPFHEALDALTAALELRVGGRKFRERREERRDAFEERRRARKDALAKALDPGIA